MKIWTSFERPLFEWAIDIKLELGFFTLFRFMYFNREWFVTLLNCSVGIDVIDPFEELPETMSALVGEISEWTVDASDTD